jgi:hypothetical protein
VTQLAAYRPVAFAAVVAGSLIVFLSFFFVFLIAPIVPLALFYLGYLAVRERRLRRERRGERGLLDREADARDDQLHREGL